MRHKRLASRVIAVIFGLMAAVYGIAGATGNAAAQTASELRVGTVKNFVIRPAPKPLPEVRFQDGEGRDHAFSDFRGKIVLVNFWATWCAPCRREMPALDRLQKAIGGDNFQVVLISLDRAGYAKAVDFLDQIEVENLGTYIDTSNKSARKLGALGLPTTLLLNRKGDEIGRLAGPAEWDAPEAQALIARYITEDD